MISFNLHKKYGALNSKPVFEAFEKGIKRLGYKTDKNGIDVIWSVLWNGRMAANKAIWKQAARERRPVIVLEVGALQRNKLWKMGVGGVNNDAYFGPRANDRQRADKLGLKLDPWRTNDGPILIACQHNNSPQWNSPASQERWTTETIETIRKHTDRQIILRQHPRCPIRFKNLPANTILQLPKKIPNTYDDYDFDVSRAYAVINWSSNPGIIAAMRGVPVFTSFSSLAWSVANLDVNKINNPDTPDRRQWLNDLAHTEWTTEEIATGEPIARLTSVLK